MFPAARSAEFRVETAQIEHHQTVRPMQREEVSMCPMAGEGGCCLNPGLRTEGWLARRNRNRVLGARMLSSVVPLKHDVSGPQKQLEGEAEVTSEEPGTGGRRT